MPDIHGIDDFRGHMFHTARWDYDYSGGCPENESLTGLQGKKVGLVGTGATAVQAVPQIAKWAEQLYVFQRTPSSVDVRGNRDTDPAWYQNHVATKKGWQKERTLNFVSFTENNPDKPAVNLVNDEWTKMSSYSGLIGTAKPVTMETVAEHIATLHELDFPRQERVRQRAANIVEDPATASALQAWYPGWCKRPCFHDEYLQAFNSPNVTLVDTGGKGVDYLTQKGIEFAGHEYELDLIIWSTGFRIPSLGSAAGKADIAVRGRGGVSMEQRNDDGELLTLHGVSSHDFPNMFWSGPVQAGATANNTFLLDNLATHVAHIIAEADRLVGSGKKPVVEPTLEAQEQWVVQIISGAAAFAGTSNGCNASLCLEAIC